MEEFQCSALNVLHLCCVHSGVTPLIDQILYASSNSSNLSIFLVPVRVQFPEGQHKDRYIFDGLLCIPHPISLLKLYSDGTNTGVNMRRPGRPHCALHKPVHVTLLVNRDGGRPGRPHSAPPNPVHVTLLGGRAGGRPGRPRYMYSRSLEIASRQCKTWCT
jgi:hypothetical protein